MSIRLLQLMTCLCLVASPAALAQATSDEDRSGAAGEKASNLDQARSAAAGEDTDPPAAAAGSDADPTTGEPADEAAELPSEASPPITVLDQVVPVAEDPPEDGVYGPPESEDEAQTDHDRLLAEFERYKELTDAGIYAEAANAAKRVVELSIRENGPRSNDTARALSNLALAQHQIGNFDAAQQNFESAIDIIIENEDRLNKMLINPLKGLGASQMRAGRPDLAAETYRRAVHISHVNEGPHNIEQIDILQALAETHLQLGDVDAARDSQDMIYALNVRHYQGRATEMIPSLMRRAEWQHRTGYIIDERATYRRIIRIIEETKGKDHFSLIRPLQKLGESYFYVDMSDTTTFEPAMVASGEIYFKRALKIAEEHPEADWRDIADAMIALGDYYNFRSDLGRSRKTYRDAWEFLSSGRERLQARSNLLEQVVTLHEQPVPRYAGDATAQDKANSDPDLREGRIVVSFDINTRGRVSNLRVVESQPAEFEDMRDFVIREMRKRVYRPRLANGQAIDTPNQVMAHTFYYLQDDLDERRTGTAAEESL
jgi:tetratricopeptide (TPR) repeat protein